MHFRYKQHISQLETGLNDKKTHLNSKSCTEETKELHQQLKQLEKDHFRSKLKFDKIRQQREKLQRRLVLINGNLRSLDRDLKQTISQYVLISDNELGHVISLLKIKSSSNEKLHNSSGQVEQITQRQLDSTTNGVNRTTHITSQGSDDMGAKTTSAPLLKTPKQHAASLHREGASRMNQQKLNQMFGIPARPVRPRKFYAKFTSSRSPSKLPPLVENSPTTDVATNDHLRLASESNMKTPASVPGCHVTNVYHQNIYQYVEATPHGRKRHKYSGAAYDERRHLRSEYEYELDRSYNITPEKREDEPAARKEIVVTLPSINDGAHKKRHANDSASQSHASGIGIARQFRQRNSYHDTYVSKRKLSDFLQLWRCACTNRKH